MAFNPDGVTIQLIYLLEIDVGYRLDTASWTQAAAPNTNCYYMTWPTWAMPPWKVEDIDEEYSEKVSLANCHSTEKSWFYDSANGRLYVHLEGAAEPAEATPYLQASFWSRHANKAYEYDGHAYRPDLDDESIPEVSSSTGEYYEGQTERGFGSIKLLNDANYYDSKLDLPFIWEARRYYLRVGEEGKGDANFTVAYDGYTGDIEWSEDEVVIATEDLLTQVI